MVNGNVSQNFDEQRMAAVAMFLFMENQSITHRTAAMMTTVSPRSDGDGIDVAGATRALLAGINEGC